MYKRLLIVILILTLIELSEEKGATIPNKIKFPYGDPFMGLFLAVAMPLEIPEPEVFVSYNFEANYDLPENQSSFDYPPDISRAMDIDRKRVYNALEFKMDSHGFTGKHCLLRAICEASEYNFQHTGILADIIHVILTPSTSRSEDLMEYESAETYGRVNRHCKNYNKLCPISVVNLISIIGAKFNV